MSNLNHNIVTRNDIESINQDREGKSSTLDQILRIVMWILIIGGIFYLIYKLINKDKYTYTDENGESHDVSTNFSKQDLQEVYKELSEIPLEI